MEECKPGNAPQLLFSAMDASVATEIERAFAQAGHVVVSNSRNHRMERDVPLLVPEINPDHLKLVPGQQRARGWKGQIVTNPNCSTIVLTMGLAPLKQFGITEIVATTMQAISGAGYPGVPSMDIMGNVIPFIGGEEEKMQQETQKILGEFRGDRIEPLAASVSAHCNRVPVVDGHTVTVSVELSSKPSEADLRNAFETFTGVPQQRHLPSAPAASRACIWTEANRPQPRKDAERDRGMAAFVGRLAPLPGARLEVRRAGPQHHARRRRRGRAQRRADALGRFTRLRWTEMIVMKFGGTSVESAAGHRTRRRYRQGAGGPPSRWWWFRPWARPPTSCWPSPRPPSRASATNTSASCTICAISIRAKPASVVPLEHRAELDRTLDDHFQEMTELVKGLAVLGRTDAALDRRHLELWRAALELHRRAGLRAFRTAVRARRFAAT